MRADNTYNVKYVLDSRRERKVPDCFILKPSDELATDVTPSRAVKQRQRRATKYSTGDTPSSEETSQSPPSGARGKPVDSGGNMASGKRKRADMVLLCSGYDAKGTNEIEKWSEVVGAEIVASWTNRVTHLVVKCVVGEKPGGGEDAKNGAAAGRLGGNSGKRQLFGDTRAVKRWVKIRSMKYLKALVGGRWIVSEEWLQGTTAPFCCALGPSSSLTLVSCVVGSLRDSRQACQ